MMFDMHRLNQKYTKTQHSMAAEWWIGLIWDSQPMTLVASTCWNRLTAKFAYAQILIVAVLQQPLARKYCKCFFLMLFML